MSYILNIVDEESGALMATSVLSGDEEFNATLAFIRELHDPESSEDKEVWVEVECTNWVCNRCDSGNYCPFYAPQEVPLSMIPEELREFYKDEL